MSTRGTVPTALLQALADGLQRSTDDMAVLLDLPGKKISDAASRLAARGYLERHAAGLYQLTPAGRAAAQAGERITSGRRGCFTTPQNSLRQRAWWAMRVRRHFTVGDLVSDAVRDGELAYKTLQGYLRQLELAGIVGAAGRKPGRRRGSNGARLYRLLRDTGPLAPVYRATLDAVHDRNTGEDVPCAPSR